MVISLIIFAISLALTGPCVPNNLYNIGIPKVEKAAYAETGKPGQIMMGVFLTIPSPVGDPGFIAIP
jgi:hypothetical protein